MTIRNSPNADQCVLSGPSYAKWHPKNYGQNGERLGEKTGQRIPCKCWQNRFLTTYFFVGCCSPGRISWPAG